MSKNEVMTEIMAIDLGNRNTKTSNEVVFQSRIRELGEFEEVQKAQEIIEINQKRYSISDGDWEQVSDKAVKQSNIPNLLSAIIKTADTEENEFKVKVVLGLPLVFIGRKDTLKEKIEGKTFNFKYKAADAANYIDKKITIEKIAVLAEGFSSVYSIPKKQRDGKELLLIDLGGFTCNILRVDKDGRMQANDTIDEGVDNLEKKFQILMTNMYGKKIEDPDVLTYMGNNKLFEEKGSYNKVNLEKLKTDFINDIYKKLGRKFDLDIVQKVYLIGGGSILLEDELKERFGETRTVLVDNPLFANVLGNYNMAKANWGVK